MERGFNLGRDLFNDIQSDSRLAVAAEDELPVFIRGADRGDDLFGRRLVLQPELVFLVERRAFITDAERALVGAAVGDIEIKSIPDGISDVLHFE